MRSHLPEILDFSNIQHASAKDYRLIINTVRQTLHAISQLDIDTGTWDPMIIEVLLRKLNADFIEPWETSGHGVKPMCKNMCKNIISYQCPFHTFCFIS